MVSSSSPPLTFAGGAVSRIVLGTERLGSVLPDALSSSSDRDKTFRHLDAVLDLGCTAIDTAASYQVGGTERLLGQWIHSRRNRDRLFLISKGAHPVPILRPNRLTPADLRADLDDSLRRLQTDRIDLYLVHRDSPGVALEPVLAALVGFQRQGKIGGYGVSNWSHQRVAALDELARSRGEPRPLASSPHFSLVDWVRAPWTGSVSIAGPSHRDARAYYEERQMAVLAWSPLGRGFFSSAAPTGDRIYGSDANAARRRRAQLLAARHRRTPAQIALAYLFSQPFPVHAVVSTTSVSNMRLDLEAVGLRLSPQETAWLESGGDSPPPEPIG